jgi:hypothetical protein
VTHDKQRPPSRREVSGAILWLALGVLAVGVVYAVGTVYTLVGDIRDTQVNSVEVLEAVEEATSEARRAAEAVEDCTTPKGDCYQESTERTQEAVGNIGLLAIYAAACEAAESRADDFATIPTQELADRISVCVEDVLAANQAGDVPD